MLSQNNGRIALGMSGGVDSAASAALLLRAGYDVVGVTCRFQNSEAAECAVADAAAVCDVLGIPHRVYDCTERFSRCVIDPFVQGFEHGTTPNPCIECNVKCKLPSLLAAAEDLECAQVATGHYARIVQHTISRRFIVKTALDGQKDQSYMLALLTQDQLKRLVLPLGDMTKAQVRTLAEELELPVANKPESQDVCFIEGDYRDFLRDEGICDQPGNIVDRAGNVLGEHDGLVRFTIGQRKGLGIAADQPYYVLEKRPATNELVVGFADEAYITSALLGDLNWQAWSANEISSVPIEAFVKLRYRTQAVPCIIEPEGITGTRITLLSPQPTTAPGQYAVFYAGDTVLGGGIIQEVGQA